MMQHKVLIRFFKALAGTFLSLAVIQLTHANGEPEPESGYYKVEDGKVDPATFIGWSNYHNACVGCHGVGGVGTEVAPDLTESVNRLSPAEFRIKVLHQYAIRFTQDDWRDMEEAMFEEILKQEQRDAGELENMPRWENNPVVKENVHNIYRYLKARADGAIGPDRPEVMKE